MQKGCYAMMANRSNMSHENAINPPSKPRGKKPFPRPRPHFKSTEFPGPSKKSTHETPLTNDPLWKDALVTEGEHGVLPIDAIATTSADALGYVELIEQEYDAIASCDKAFGKNVPLSAFANYHHILWWYKIALLDAKHGKASHDQLNLIQFVEGYDTVVGAGAATYIEGLGDFTAMNGVKYYVTAREPNGQGHFGAITELTHSLYETHIAPAVSFGTVLADIAATRERREENDWWTDEIEIAVPQPVRPAEEPEPRAEARPARAPRLRRQEDLDQPPAVEGVGEQPEPEEPEEEEDEEEDDNANDPRWRPTYNLLGWRLGRPLAKNQSQALLNLIPDMDHVIYHNRRYAIHRGLFEYVRSRLELVTKYQIVPLPRNPNGTVAQQVVWKPSVPIVSRFARYISGEGRAQTSTMVPTRIVQGGRVFCYKVMRSEFEDEEEDHILRPWSCIWFDRYREVPDNWSANRNRLLVQGMVELFERLKFSTGHQNRYDAVTEVLDKFKTPLNRA